MPSRTVNAPSLVPARDQLIQRVLTGTLLAVALSLVGAAFVLYV